MTRADLAKIFNEVDATFYQSDIYKAIIHDIGDELAEAKRPREMILMDGTAEIVKRFMFEVICKVVSDAENTR